MRLSTLLFFSIAPIYGLFSSPVQAHINTSFGPEISAEDFKQHAHSLSELKAFNLRQDYLSLQFKRLGLSSSALACQTPARGQLAILKGTNSNRTDSAMFFAAMDDIYQIASVLEIAERFMTTKPRPEHDVMFVFSDSSPETLTQCSMLKQIRLTIQPKNMEKLDSSSLIRDLNALQRQGK
jgi:hypothetical protein